MWHRICLLGQLTFFRRFNTQLENDEDTSNFDEVLDDAEGKPRKRYVSVGTFKDF